MKKLLHLKASPREESFSARVAQVLIEAVSRRHEGLEVDTLDLSAEALPQFAAPQAQAKYAVLAGREPSGPAERAWKRVIGVIDRFKSADAYVISCPMWNFGIPYRLKQYIDLIVQPGLTFRFSPEEGYVGLVTGRPAVLVLARGGAYSPPAETAGLDFQRPYLQTILGFMGFRDVRDIVIEPTLQDGPDAAGRALEKVLAEARGVAERLG